MRRRGFLALAAGAAAATALPRRLVAQQANTKRIGFMSSSMAGSALGLTRRDAFWAGVGKSGWTESNLFADYRWGATTTEEVTRAAAQLVAAKPDLLFVAAGSANLTAIARLTQTTPIAFGGVSAVTVAGLVSNFARPGGNITGFMNTPDEEVYGKIIDILKNTLPGMIGVGAMFGPDAVPGGEAAFISSVNRFAARQNLILTAYPVRSESDAVAAVSKIAADRSFGVYFEGDAQISAFRSTVIAEVAKHRVVAISGANPSFTDEGGLLSYAPDQVIVIRGGGEYAGLILNGAKITDLPIQTSPLLLTVNLKTAKALGISIPAGVLSIADNVIE